MALTIADENTQSAVVGNTYTLATITSSLPATFVLHVDLGPMTNGDSSNAADEFEVIISTIARSGGTERVARTLVFKGVQTEPQWYSEAFPVGYSIKFQLKDVAGQNRSIPWVVYKY